MSIMLLLIAKASRAALWSKAGCEQFPDDTVSPARCVVFQSYTTESLSSHKELGPWAQPHSKSNIKGTSER